jgi:GH25 family lysozyme M1 (1,4-beta-N-acetylmuramidase)
MKKLLFLFSASVILAIGLISCNSNSPKSTAETFLNNFYHMDYKEAKTVATDETKKVLDMIEQFATMIPDSQKQNAKKIKIDIKDVKEEGDKATVVYTTSENKQDQKLDLVKQNGKWLVKWSKQNDGEGETPADGAAEEAGLADTTAPAVDGTAAPTDTAAKK